MCEEGREQGAITETDEGEWRLLRVGGKGRLLQGNKEERERFSKPNSVCKDLEAQTSSLSVRNLNVAKGERTLRYPVWGCSQEEFLSNVTSLLYSMSGNGSLLFNFYDIRYIQMTFKLSAREKGNIRKLPIWGKRE